VRRLAGERGDVVLDLRRDVVRSDADRMADETAAVYAKYVR